MTIAITALRILASLVLFGGVAAMVATTNTPHVFTALIATTLIGSAISALIEWLEGRIAYGDKR